MTDPHQAATPDPSADAASADVSRRGLLTTGLAALAGVSGLAAAMSPLRDLKPGDLPTLDEFLQKHYKEMTPEDKERVFARFRQRVKDRFHVDPELSDPAPLADVEYVYGLNLSQIELNVCVSG